MGDDSPVQILMKKGRRGAAAHVHADCANNTSSGVLGEILDILLNPSKNIDEWETLDWIKWLMAGGRTPDEFSSIVRRYDNATTCGLVWTANFVAYRCRTCGISPCMSLCAECFQKGDHDGHDFNMFRSQAGGACDCGDTSVMKETGFCDRHGPQAQVNKPSVPSDLMCTSEAIMPQLIMRLIQHLRENSKSGLQDAHIVAIMEADNFLTMLHEFSAMGAAMRRVMTAALTNPQLYKHLTECCENAYMTESQRIYKEALASLPNPEPHPQYIDCPALSQTLVHKTFLEELVFWTVKFEFPQKVVCLLLNMLPDPDYKEALTQAFVLHYSRISMMLERSSDPDTLSNRVVHVSVQLFSNEALALRMVDKLNLLHVMVTSLKYMMSKILIPNTLHCPEKNFHFVVDCGLQVMKEHCYWPLVSDLNNVLSHRPVAVRFMSDDSLLEMWFDFLSMFQGMNVNQRELVQHVEFEPNTYYAAFSAELEASAYPMWALLSHLRDTSTLDLTKRVLASCLSALRDWLEAINMTQSDIPDSNQVSFHLPLHRYLSVFMCQAINVQGVSLQEVLPPQDMLKLIMMHPLRVQAAFYEILNGLWVRNGLQIKGQAMTYIQCNFCNSMVDADMYLLQICATQIPADTYMQTVIDKFHIKEWLSFVSSPMSDNNAADSESETPMLESCLTFLASLISLRTNLGAKQCALSQLEMVTLLCMCDKTHSQLMELMPERCGTAQSRDFESVLQEVADYKAPNLEASGNMQQGMYVPKARVWEELYDPIHVLLRAVHRRDFQNSMDRFSEYAQQIGRIRQGTTAWPPFRTPWPVHPAYQDPRKVLRTKVFHALVWTVLYKATLEHTVSEHVTAVLIYLLEQAIAIDDPHDQMCPTTMSAPQSRHVRDTDLGNWFETDWLSCNLRTVIQSITLPEPVFACDSDSDSEWVQVRGGIGGSGPPPLALPQPHTHTHMPGIPALLPAAAAQSMFSMALVPHLAAIEGAEPMEALPPSTQPLAVTAGNEMISASSFQHQPSSSISTSSSSSSNSGLNFHHHHCLPALPGPSSSTATTTVQLAKRRTHAERSKQSDYSVELPSPDRSVEANESIISLLLKLHSHLSGVPDSFNPDEPEVDRESRIGDGAFFVGKVLRRIMEIDSFCRESVVQTRERLWPRQPEEGEAERREREERERAERRRKAKERQQKLMEEFASKQKQFMEKAMETEDEALGMDWDGAEQVLTTKKEYDCVICSQTSPSTDDKPMGLAVLVQATSVLGHKRRSAEPAVLPTSDEERQVFQQSGNLSLAADFDRKIEELDREFNQLSWLVSVNLGWEGGVHVQTCGHHLHLDCLKAYLRSLRNQQRLSSERGEYSCPLCRRLANSVLPLPPQLGECAAVVRSRPVTLNAIITELVKFLKENPPTKPVVSSLMDAMGKSMEDMTNSTYLKFKQKSGTRQPQTLFLFVTSIARTNLEVELVQREGSLVTPKSTECIPKRSCIMPLLHVLAVHARLLAHWPTWETFQMLAGVTEEPQQESVPALTVLGNTVPLLLCDPCALLTQFILLLPLHLDQTYFSCVVKLLYNLLYMQVTVQLSCLMSEAQRSQWRRRPSPAPDTPVSKLEDAMALTIHLLDHTSLYLSDEVVDSLELPTIDHQAVENQIQQLCLPFLRIAALLRHHLYEQELPKIHTESSEFVILVYYLELVEGGMTLEQFNAAVALSWPEPTGCHLIAWTRQLAEFINRSQVTARSFLSEQHITWHQPRLLSLPELYDKIFQYYHRRQCSQCHSVPRETSVCLVCGALVCLKENCCKQLNVCEAVQHSVDCGAGTAMYLVVTSSYVIVIRGKRACLWGSVYLDSFGEEDRELKRGKPLYLSPGRYQLLQQQWLGHHFDHTPKKWVWHRDAL